LPVAGQGSDYMQRKFIYFINPVSGTKSKEPLLRLIEKEHEKNNIPFEVLPTRKDANYSFLPSRINTENITDIIVCGGDGSVSQVAAYLLKTKVNIGIIPMGSGNGLALAAGIRRDHTKALEIIFKGHAALVDGFYINSRFSCMLCGLGFDAQVAHDFSRQSTRGLATYVKQTIKNFFTAPCYPFVIEINGQLIKTEAFFISIANSNQFGNNVTIAPKASLNDGLLDIVIVNKMNKLHTLFSLLKQIRMGKVKQEPGNSSTVHKGITYLQASKLLIRNPVMAPLHIDGDPAESSSKFVIEVIPEAFRLLQP
jgi:YegS/Rv2252/BmrU family lipid kinase